MAPLAKRFASARLQARRAPIRVSAIERELGTRYTIDTLRKLVRRWPKHRFIWLMGSDNLEQFARWKEWRGIARLMPIAVIARPGYDGAALASPAMAWLRRFRRSGASLTTVSKHGAGWSTPALIYLRFDPDQRSATAMRRADSQWAGRLPVKALRDGITRRPIPEHAA
jgi:nicotinate-nucleotide adenylyltransferase